MSVSSPHAWLCVAIVGMPPLVIGCSSAQPSWRIPSYRFKQTHIQSLVAPNGTVRLWFDQDPGEITVRITGPDHLPIDPQPEDRIPGFLGGGRLRDGRIFSFRCLTKDGVYGTITFTLDEKPFPNDGAYQLRNGHLFLIEIRNEIQIRQLDRQIHDAGNNAELEAVVAADPALSKFVAKGE